MKLNKIAEGRYTKYLRELARTNHDELKAHILNMSNKISDSDKFALGLNYSDSNNTIESIKNYLNNTKKMNTKSNESFNVFKRKGEVISDKKRFMTDDEIQHVKGRRLYKDFYNSNVFTNSNYKTNRKIFLNKQEVISKKHINGGALDMAAGLFLGSTKNKLKNIFGLVGTALKRKI